MGWVEWMLTVILFTLYIACIFTVCSLTFQKGYTVLGFVGIFIPFLWLIGAILPAKPGSQFEISQQQAFQQQAQSYTA